MIILYSHQKGGVGKSTLAINHAYIKGYPIVDLDSQNSAFLFNKLREADNKSVLDCHVVENVEELKNMLAPYANNKDNHIIIDSGGYDSQINRYALLLSDFIITPVGLSQIELFGLQKFRKVLKQASSTTNTPVYSHALINNVDIRAKTKIEEVKEYILNNDTYFRLLDTTVHTRADIKYSYGNGQSITEYMPDCKAAMEIEAMVEEVSKKAL